MVNNNYYLLLLLLLITITYYYYNIRLGKGLLINTITPLDHQSIIL